jgi:hypothetical protein
VFVPRHLTVAGADAFDEAQDDGVVANQLGGWRMRVHVQVVQVERKVERRTLLPFTAVAAH